MKNLSKLLRNEIAKNKKEVLAKIKELNISNAKGLDWQLAILLPKAKENFQFESVKVLKDYLISRLEKATTKKIIEADKKLLFNENLSSIEELTINVEWKKSSTWGSNPTAEAYVNGVGRVSSGSIGGCGYDKQSTAVANVLNQVPQFKKLLFEYKNKPKNFKLSNHEIFGYGSGYGVLPSFKGGVGVNCYNQIFNKIGYEFKTVSSGNTFDVYKVVKIK